ncbi:substrate-binding domain-containing protein [Tengunoibacter tsumagoiensis]|uniref:HTH gntR-type domain-containing protein n=1 Tax=Tengunoibacter tsumagoiensis TaxID=2014871 RepID=A0A401ZYP4_9CHLR|nr:substrate-binding domain-containing protein [Tengunoibacter tsumagoiensis]GCE11976.1 hypothetical protein KTT_18350 [Tengunoibacter tsumagoiensis]
MATIRPSREDTKLEELSKRLRDLAYEKGPGAQLPTVRSLCEMLGTTRVTIGEVLNMLEAENILYRKDRQGIFVSPTIHHKSICILFDSTNLRGPSIPPFWPLLWVRLEEEAQRRASLREETYTFHVITPLQNEQDSVREDIMKLLQHGMAHGILGVGLRSVTREWLETLPVPYVAFAGPSCWIVQLDGTELGRQATTTLVQQGCKQIGFWMYQTDLQYLNEFQSFRRTLTKLKAPFYPELIQQPHLFLSHTPSLQEQGYMLAREVFGPLNRMKPDGLFIGNDMLTDGAMAAFEEMNIRVGEDVKIVTHGNVGSPVLFGRTKKMTIFDYDVDDIVHTLFYMLDSLMAGQKPSEEVAWIKPKLRSR